MTVKVSTCEYVYCTPTHIHMKMLPVPASAPPSPVTHIGRITPLQTALEEPDIPPLPEGEEWSGHVQLLCIAL